MTMQRLLKWGGLTAGAICLAAGDILIGQWILLACVGVAWLTGSFSARWFGVAFIALVGLAAAGVCAGASFPLTIAGATLALAGWDLENWEKFVENGLPVKALARFERRHVGFLGLALGAGFVAAILGRSIHFRLPFGILAILALLVVLGIDRLWCFSNKQSQ
jgi:hypothetical protein